MTYAQESRGQKLHLVKQGDDYPGGVATSALCGRSAPNGWRMTINVPLRHACHNCLRVYHARSGAAGQPEA